MFALLTQCQYRETEQLFFLTTMNRVQVSCKMAEGRSSMVLCSAMVEHVGANSEGLSALKVGGTSAMTGVVTGWETRCPR